MKSRRVIYGKKMELIYRPFTIFAVFVHILLL